MLGWAVLLIGLATAALLYVAAADRGRLRPSLVSGVVYGAICWLIAGAVVMPLLGVIAPAPATSTTAPPDPMRGSFMMLNLGVAAPIVALIAWLMFGAVLGAAAGWRPSYPWLRTNDPGKSRTVMVAAALAIVAMLAVGLFVVRLDTPPADTSPAGTATLATEPVQVLPLGADFFSVIELSQTPGATLGPHAHAYAGFAYSIKGVASIAFTNGPTTRVAPGEVGFIGTQVSHAHQNTDDRGPTAALALLIIALIGVLCLISLRPARRDGRLLAVVLVLLIATGALATLDPWSNDWLFLSVRAVALRGAEMPVATSSRLFESPNIGPLAPGAYVETLKEITVAPGVPATDVGSAGTAVLVSLDGSVDVQPAGGSSIQLGARGATLLQPGASVTVTDGGAAPAHVLELSVTPAAPAG